jgi:Kdo2-lipid IVA lauroyltransferase/acyltransferase
MMMRERLKLNFLKFAFKLLGHVPLIVLHFLGTLLGSLVFILPIRPRYYASANLKLCFPELSFIHHQYRLFRSLCEIGKGLCETPVFWIRKQQSLLKLVRNQSAFSQVAEVHKMHHGVIMLGLHLGGFYLQNAFIAHELPDTTWIYKPLKGAMGAFFEEKKNKFGGNLVTASRSGVLSIFRHLKKGGAVGISCDHNVLDYGAVWAPFFCIDVPSTNLPTKLAAKTRAPVFVSVMERLSWGRGYHLHIWRASDELYSDAPLVATTAMNAEVEKAVRMFPTQHEWLYRRFWDRPEGSPPLYKSQIKQ